MITTNFSVNTLPCLYFGVGVKPGLWTLDWTHGLDSGLDSGLEFGLLASAWLSVVLHFFVWTVHRASWSVRPTMSSEATAIVISSSSEEDSDFEVDGGEDLTFTPTKRYAWV